MKSLLSSLLATSLLLASARADHGQEFFLLYDAKVRAPGHGSVQSTFSFLDEGDDDTLSLSPGFTLGVLPRTALSVRADFADEASSSWAYRAIEPGFQIDLTPKNLKLPIRFGLSASYQFAEPEAASDALEVHSVSGHHLEEASRPPSSSSMTPAPLHDHGAHDHSSDPLPSPGVDLGPDALTPEELAAMSAAASPPASAAAPRTQSPAPAQPKPSPHHSHAASGHTHAGGIHNHEDNLFTARLALEVDFSPDTLLIGNLISVLPSGGSASWGYAVGLRQRFLPQLSCGLEALGDFSTDGHHEALAALYWEPIHHLILKTGLGTGLTSTSPDASLRAGLVWIF